jgi:hypothetical protein
VIVVVPAVKATRGAVAMPDAFVTAFAVTVATRGLEEEKLTVRPPLGRPSMVTVAVAALGVPTSTVD